jgi:hypothetical protein
MVFHPPRRLRAYVVFAAGLSAGAAAASAAVCGVALWSWDASVLGAMALVCLGLAAATLAVGLARLAWVLQGGPEAQRALVSADSLLTASLLLTGTAISGMALMMLSKQLAGEGRAPDLLLYPLSAVVGLLGATLFLGFCLRFANQLLRGPTVFVQEDTGAAPGGVLRGRLEVPFSAERALELEVSIECIRSQPGYSPDDPREQSVIFAASIRTVASLPIGARRAGALLEVPLEFDPSCASDAPAITYFCHMEVKPVNADVWWNAVLAPEIAWK